MTASPILFWRCGRSTVRLAGALEAPGTRQVLVTQLLATMPPPAEDFQLEHNPLGKPLLLAVCGHPSVGVSFSRHAGWLWAGATLNADIGADIGIDATGPEDFPDPYPDARVFALGELDAAAQFVSSLPEARALLWSIKEAAAKALGTGFNTVEPVHLRVEALAPADGGVLACRITSPQGVLDALTGTACGFRIAAATRLYQARSQNG
jgi:phosphopantetheinyl transferase